MAKIPVLEIFGPTIQGEGSVIGRKTLFIRTAGCDYSCSWCDSKFTWDGSEKATLFTSLELFERIISSEFQKDGCLNFDHVTISGGNPALIGSEMKSFISYLHECGLKVGVETQGSMFQDWLPLVDDLVISPKPPSSKMETNFYVLDDIIKFSNFRGNLSLKVVVFDDEDFEYARKMKLLYPDIPFYLSVGNEYVDSSKDITEQLLVKFEWLVTKVMDCTDMNNVKVLPQLHTLLWANQRGV